MRALLRALVRTVAPAIILATPVQAARLTYPAPPKTKPTDPLHVFPGYEVPQNLESYTFKLTSKIAGKPTTADETIHVYTFDDFGRRTIIGSLPEGTAMKFTTFRVASGVHFYAIPWQGTPAEGWVSGLNVAPVAYTPPAK
jgi:hypothetical protein